MVTTAQHGTAVHRFRCLDDGHVIDEPRKLAGPLVTRQSTWCVVHDCPAVVLDAAADDSRAGTSTG